MIPYGHPLAHYKTYKVAARQQTAHPTANAAFNVVAGDDMVCVRAGEYGGWTCAYVCVRIPSLATFFVLRHGVCVCGGVWRWDLCLCVRANSVMGYVFVLLAGGGVVCAAGRAAMPNECACGWAWAMFVVLMSLLNRPPLLLARFFFFCFSPHVRALQASVACV